MSLTYATPLVLSDPGFIFTAILGSTEPTHAALASTYDLDVWPVAWVAAGPTEDGSKLSYEIKAEPIRAAELFDPIRWATTDRSGSFSFSIMNFTLQNLKRAYNGGTLATVSGSGATLSSSLLPPSPGSEVRTMIGWESLDHTMRVIIYQALNAGAVESMFKRAPDKALIPFTVNMEVPITAPLQPFKVYAAGTGRFGV
jgi:hypothetical protein